MAKAKGQTAKVTAAKPAGKPANGMVAKLKDFGKNVGERAIAVSVDKTAVAGRMGEVKLSTLKTTQSAQYVRKNV